MTPLTALSNAALSDLLSDAISHYRDTGALRYGAYDVLEVVREYVRRHRTNPRTGGA